MEELLTPEEVAKIVKVQPKTVREWIKTGQLKAHKVGRAWRVERPALEAFVKGGDK